MKNLKIFALSALSLFGFAACQQVEIAPDVTPEATHTVTFVAAAPETKTTVDISDGKTAKFEWTEADEDRFNLYENSTPASLTQGTLTKGVMEIEAVFDGGVSSGENTYVAVLNSANDLQILYNESYPEDADILVSKAISSFDEKNSVKLQFKREVAIAKMTLKGLDPGEVVNHITVSSTANIAGRYGVDGWSSTKTSLDIYSALAKGVGDYKIVANNAGEAVVWFTCIPQDATTLTVKVVAADGETYTKEFSKPITLTHGDVKAFGVALEKKGWRLVDDAKSLAAGDVIVIVAKDEDVALSTTQNSNNRGQQKITKNTNNNTVTIDNNVQQLTLGAGTVPGTFSLSTGPGYLYAASSSKNYLRTQTELDANSSWTITIADHVATIQANGDNSNNWLRYNSSNSIFSCYASGQDDVQIYKDTRATQSISYSAKKGSIDKYTQDKSIPTLDVSGLKTTVSYTSSDETVATVSNTGEITPKQAGTTTITAIAAASAEYREAKASFVLTVTDSTPYLTATANKTSVEAAGGIVTITVDTNVGNWTALSDNGDFVVGTPSGNTVEITVSKNTGDERTATITITAGTLSKEITLTQEAAGAAASKRYTLTITPSSFNSDSYAANNIEKNTQAVAEDGSTINVTWYSNQIMLQSKAMQWQKKTAYLYNITDLGKIESVTVNSTAGTFTTYYGSTQNPTSGTTVGGGYFNVKVGSDTGKTTSVVVVFKK